jgi:hypothetical protein
MNTTFILLQKKKIKEKGQKHKYQKQRIPMQFFGGVERKEKNVR